MDSDKEKFFSIIIPVYNAERFLKRCLDSILDQSFDDYEIILVDDGSTDCSNTICNKYSIAHSNIRTIRQRNGGVSSARNVGLKYATGKYILFIDSDDFIEKSFLEKISIPDGDLVLCGFSDYYKNHVVKNIFREDTTYFLNNDSGLLKYLKIKDNSFVWGKRYKRSIIQNHDIRFLENLKFSEDIVFNNTYILQCCKAVALNYQGYYHCQYDDYLTLSMRVKEASYLERNIFRRISYDLFKGHEKAQQIYVKQSLYYAELEFVKISNGKGSFSQKKKKIMSILNDDFFQTCTRLEKKVLPKDTMLFCNCKLPLFLLAKYKNKYV